MVDDPKCPVCQTALDPSEISELQHVSPNRDGFHQTYDIPRSSDDARPNDLDGDDAVGTYAGTLFDQENSVDGGMNRPNSPLQQRGSLLIPRQPRTYANGMFPTYQPEMQSQQALLEALRIGPNIEGVLIDSGACDYPGGDVFDARMKALLKGQGRKSGYVD